ncbi:kinase-like domain-containing protein [Chiua virens]|nr:kinase-like domain-containing protein [Chiua virens]
MSQRPSTESSGSAPGLSPNTASGQDRSPSPAPSTASRTRGEDYIYFERSTEGFSPDAVSRATAAKLKLESYYKLAVDVAIERKRRVELEQKINQSVIPNEAKEREIRKYRKLESQHLEASENKDPFIGLSDGQGHWQGCVRRGQARSEDGYGQGICHEDVTEGGNVETGSGRLSRRRTLPRVISVVHPACPLFGRNVICWPESTSPWVVQLFYSFQDPLYLYLIMEFLPGGDLMTMLMKYDVFSEDVTRFYMAECILAIEAVHDLGYIHRDIKPDNILIDKNGHLKLSDFGLSTGLHKTTDGDFYKRFIEQEKQRDPARNSVQVNANSSHHEPGTNSYLESESSEARVFYRTPDYIAPEVFMLKGYGKECDWWSLGAITFECLVGYAPFCSENPNDTYKKIIEWPNYLYFPDEVHLSKEAEHLIRGMMNWTSKRLGSSITDTTYFPTDELGNLPDQLEAVEQVGSDKDLAFLGFTFKRFT